MPYKVISNEEYNTRFEINIKKSKLRKKAFKKAWEIRNFEIDKFWQRSAYFWGFIVLIFGGYGYVVTGKPDSYALKNYFDLYLILLGCIFSVGWLLVIKGSIAWQNNWEAHIDMLEDAITGPLYKTVYVKKGKWFYSVSKISETLAWGVIATWILLLFRYVYDLFKLRCFLLPCVEKILFIMFPIVLTAVFIFYCLIKKCQSANGEFKVDTNEKNGVFVDMKENSE